MNKIYFFISTLVGLTVLSGGVAGAQGAGNLYNMDQMLSAPHPFAGQKGTRWSPALGGSAPVSPPAQTANGIRQPVAAAKPVVQTDGRKTTTAQETPMTSGGVWRFEYGNEDRGGLTDIFEPIFDPVFGGSPTDGGLTWGWRASYTPNSPNPDWFRKLQPHLFWVNPKTASRVSYSLEQEAITPSNLAKAEGRTVRPHAGHLSFGARVVLKNELTPKHQQLDGFDFALGLAGPISGAQKVHEMVHGSINEESDNWNEIKSEPILNLGYEYGHRFFLLDSSAAANIEVNPYAGAALGNALTYASMGMHVRFGKNLLRDLGAPRLRTLLSGENFVDPGTYWAWNFFLGAEGRAIAHSIFLDGNILRDSPSVDKKPFVYDVQLGVEGGYGAYRFSLMNVYRSREFDGQQYSTEFVRLAASASF